MKLSVPCSMNSSVFPVTDYNGTIVNEDEATGKHVLSSTSSRIYQTNSYTRDRNQNDKEKLFRGQSVVCCHASELIIP